MGQARHGRPRPLVALLTVVAVLVAAVVTGCSSDAGGTPQTPADPKPVVVSAGQATTVLLGNGADLIIPPGAMTPGATVRATYQGEPGGTYVDSRPTGSPVELVSNPPNAIHGLLTLEFPVPAGTLQPGVDPSTQFGMATYDPATSTWLPYASTYDAARHMIVAQIPHFSWWNPFTWDFDKIWASVAQDFGQAVGARAKPASCSGGTPSWVAQLAGVTNDADVAIRSCAQAHGNVLDVEMMNNRPYGQVLTYGAPVQWGWHDPGGSEYDKWRNRAMDSQMATNELYLPPLSKASVGIPPLPPGQNAVFHIGPTDLSAGIDFAGWIFWKAIGKLPQVDKCAQFLVKAPVLSSISPSILRSDVTAGMSCLIEGYKLGVSSGLLDSWTVSKAAGILASLKSASLLATGISIAGGVTWKIGDLFFDGITNAGDLGHGFSVRAHAAQAVVPPQSSGPQQSQPAAPSQPGPAQTQPQPPPNPSPAPQPPATYAETVGGNAHTWTNYTNAGGYEGPTIPAYTTVEIACKLSGFRVQDGNTWWYQIASTPWNPSILRICRRLLQQWGDVRQLGWYALVRSNRTELLTASGIATGWATAEVWRASPVVDR